MTQQSFLLAAEGIAAFGVGRRRVTIVAAALCVDDVAPESDQRGVEMTKIERHWRNPEALQNAAVEILSVVELLGLPIPDSEDCHSSREHEYRRANSESCVHRSTSPGNGGHPRPRGRSTERG